MNGVSTIPSPIRLLIVDDDLGTEGGRGASSRANLEAVIGDLHAISFCSGYDDFLKRYDLGVVREQILSVRPNVLLLDIGFGDQPMLGFKFLEGLVAEFPTLPIIMLSALDRQDNLDEALERGAVDFLNKDSINHEVFWLTVMRYRHRDPSHWIIGQHGEFQQAVYFGGHLALAGGNLLIQGEDGSGKDQILAFARSVACELAGAADLLVLPNLDRLEASEQLATLKSVRNATENGTAIFATSSRPLIGLVKRGVFRRDLFEAVSSFRSSGTAVIQLPPLRERRSDLPLILRKMLLAEAAGKPCPSPRDIAIWLTSARNASDPQLTFGDVETLARDLQDFDFSAASNAAQSVAINTAGTKPRQAIVRATYREQHSKVDDFLHRVASHRDAYEITVAGFPLIVLPDVFSPKYSHSSDFLIEHLHRMDNARILDLGAGTGVLGIACLMLKGAAHATFVDINPRAIENVQTNLANLKLAQRGRAMVSDMFERIEGKFDVIVSNPPFWNAPAKTMLERSCYDEDHNFLRKLISEGADHLVPGGVLAIVLSDQSDLALLMRELCTHRWTVQKIALQPSGAGGDLQHVRFVCIAIHGGA